MSNIINIDELMYDTLKRLPLGNFSYNWVVFNNGLFDGKPTLMKYIPGMQKGMSLLRYLNEEGFEIPLVALNPLVAEIICKKGDPNAQVAEYFLVKHNQQIFICTPSFKEKNEEFIEGIDILKPEHQRLKTAYPSDVLIMVSDIIEQLNRRKVSKKLIDEIIKQFIKDCFKNAYMEMLDPHNTNFGILYSGPESTRIAPLYDLDIGLGVPFEYADGINPSMKATMDEFIGMIKSPDYLPNYINTISKKFPWFNKWVNEWIENLSNIDLETILLEQKGIHIKPEQIKHYVDFINSKNRIIKWYYDHYNAHDGYER